MHEPMTEVTSSPITLGEHVFSQCSLVGRRTFLYAVNVKKGPSCEAHEAVVKFAYQTVVRAREQDLVGKARAAGVKHLPKIEMSADLCNLSDFIRKDFVDANSIGLAYEHRTLRAIVYHRYRPLKEVFPEHCLLIPVMVDQMIDCEPFVCTTILRTHVLGCLGLYSLRTDARILHRDISVNNVMFEIKEDGSYNFVLIDFDMATTVVSDGHPGEPAYRLASHDCTGTLPFMARELIRTWLAGSARRKNFKHCLRHDLESLFFLAIWCLAMFVHHGLKSTDIADLKRAMRAWEGSDLDSIAKLKDSYCQSGAELRFSRDADALGDWLSAWRRLFAHSNGLVRDHVDALRTCAVRNKPAPAFNWETLDDSFTAAKLKQALTPCMPLDAFGNVLDTFEDAAAYGLIPKAPSDVPAKGFTAAAVRQRSQVANSHVPDARTTPAASDTAVALNDARTTSTPPESTAGACRAPSNATDGSCVVLSRTSGVSPAIDRTVNVSPAPAVAPIAAPALAAAQPPPVEGIRSRLRPRKEHICYKY